MKHDWNTIAACLFIGGMAGGCALNPASGDFPLVSARVETRAVPSAEDAADDPAIWIHPVNPLQSLILGTDKQFGLMVYNLQGEQVQALPRGRLNNVDIRQGVRMDNTTATMAVATNRTNTAIDIFSVSATGTVSFVREQPVTLTDPYGICLYLEADGLAHIFANSSDGEYQHWLLNPGFTLNPTLVDSFMLDSQPEGCAADDTSGMLYIGEENRGIWSLPVAQISQARETMQLLDTVDSPYLRADVEGMDVWRRGDEVYLIASSQGNYSYSVYDLQDNSHIGSFRIGDSADGSVDGAQETDGLSVTSVSIAQMYPDGLLVVQDGFNTLPAENQNFKLVSWTLVLQAIKGMPED